jgi:O-antigen/teichoic acid export membrane protein
MKNSLNKLKELLYKFKDLANIGFANILTSGISFIFWLYIASILGTENYGELSYLIAISGIVSIMSLVGAGNTLIVYTAKEVKIQATIYFIAIIGSIVGSVITFILFNNIGISLYIVGYVIFGLVTSEILGRKLYSDYSKYMITQRILMVVFGIGLYHVFGPPGVLLGIAFSFFPYVFRIYKGFKETKIEIAQIKPRFGFMINSYLLDLSRTFSSSVDKLIIAPLFGFAILGNYHLSIQLLTILSILPSIVYQYVLPRDASGLSNQYLKKLTIILSVGLALIGMIFGPILLPMFFPKFTEATEIVRIVSLSVIPITVNFMYISKFMGEEKSKIVLIGSVIFIISLLISILILGNNFGVNGIALSLVIAYSSEALYLITIDKFLYKKPNSQ